MVAMERQMRTSIDGSTMGWARKLTMESTPRLASDSLPKRVIYNVNGV